MAVRACLSRVPGVTGVEVEARETYLVDADRRVAEPLATAVVGTGFGLLAMERAAVDLEALFLRLTSGRGDSAQ
jgi:hypothetical protein